MVVIGLEGEVQECHAIIIYLIREGIRAGVLVLEGGNHIEIVQFHQNLVIIGVLFTAQNHQDITKEVGLPPQIMMTKGQSSVVDLSPNLSISTLKIGGSLVRELMKAKRSQSIMVEGGLGLHHMKISTVRVVGCPHKVQMRTYQLIESVQGQDRWILSIIQR